MLAAALAAMAAAALGFLAVRTVPEALGVACLYSAACQSAYTSRGALAAFIDADDPAQLNASLYRAGNVGYALATPIVGGAVARGTTTAYRLVLLGAAVAFALAAVACVLGACAPTGLLAAAWSRITAAAGCGLRVIRAFSRSPRSMRSPACNS